MNMEKHHSYNVISSCCKQGEPEVDPQLTSFALNILTAKAVVNITMRTINVANFDPMIYPQTIQFKPNKHQNCIITFIKTVNFS